MRPRREVFALDYISDTVQCFESFSSTKDNSSLNSSEWVWARDVLHQYFSVVASHPIIDEAKQKFLALEKSLNNSSTDEFLRVPYKRDLKHPSPVNYDSLLKLAHCRRSVRWYLQKPVPRLLIDKAIEVATLSPSACNRQPFEFRIFDEPDLVQKISALPMGTKGFEHNFPVIVVLVGKLRAYECEKDRHVIYIDGSLAAMSFMFALETLGLSSCPINWPDVESLEKKMAGVLELELDERPVMLISLGYPDPEGLVAYSQKKLPNELRRYN